MTTKPEIQDEFEALVAEVVREHGQAMLDEIFSQRVEESLDNEVTEREI